MSFVSLSKMGSIVLAPRASRLMWLLCSLLALLVIQGAELSIEIEGEDSDAAASSSRSATSKKIRRCHDSDWNIHPVLCEAVLRAERDADAFALEAYEWAERHHQLVGASFVKDGGASSSRLERAKAPVLQQSFLRNSGTSRDSIHPLTTEQLPVVFAHGMGDSCFNSGFQHVVQKVAGMLSTYAVCIPTGDTQGQDTKNGYFLSMDDSVEIFASKIAQDGRLSKGFHAIGFSQGANVIRGYIAKHNSPPVHTFLSVNGVNAGVGAVPYCRPSTSSLLGSSTSVSTSMCDLLMEQASRAAYTDYAQQHSFQANYWRDPRPSEQDTYRQYSQLAAWNNEVNDPAARNQTLRDNWDRTIKFVWVLATDDEMVWPKEGEHWGAPDPTDPFERVLPRTETDWYQQDLFGLRKAEEEGKNAYETFEGDHLQFSEEDFDRWINTYLRQSSDAEIVTVQ
jgi:palmitoyl-protein thioesterase